MKALILLMTCLLKLNIVSSCLSCTLGLTRESHDDNNNGSYVLDLIPRHSWLCFHCRQFHLQVACSTLLRGPFSFLLFVCGKIVDTLENLSSFNFDFFLLSSISRPTRPSCYFLFAFFRAENCVFDKLLSWWPVAFSRFLAFRTSSSNGNEHKKAIRRERKKKFDCEKKTLFSFFFPLAFS